MTAQREAEDNNVVELPHADAPAQTDKPKKRGRRLLLMVSVPLLLVVAGGYFWLTGGRYESTDNAYVQQTIVSLSADVSGRVVAVEVGDDQPVTAGEVLFRLDPEPFEIALEQAEAALAAARSNVLQLQAAYDKALTQLDTSRAALDVAQRSQERITQLASSGVSSAAAQDNAELALSQAQADVALAEQAVNAARAALNGSPEAAIDEHPTVRSALAVVRSAQRDLDNTTVRAPANGIVSQMGSLAVGKFLTAGSTAASLVEVHDSWVEANFKETQIEALSVGQTADVTIDAYPGKVLHGTITGIGAATGAEFSLIPAQNATGNWVKVVQRIPVRVTLPEAAEVALRSGMSATVTVDTGRSHGL